MVKYSYNMIELIIRTIRQKMHLIYDEKQHNNSKYTLSLSNIFLFFKFLQKHLSYPESLINFPPSFSR